MDPVLVRIEVIRLNAACGSQLWTASSFEAGGSKCRLELCWNASIFQIITLCAAVPEFVLLPVGLLFDIFGRCNLMQFSTLTDKSEQEAEQTELQYLRTAAV